MLFVIITLIQAPVHTATAAVTATIVLCALLAAAPDKFDESHFLRDLGADPTEIYE
jgi:hypothetical protein